MRRLREEIQSAQALQDVLLPCASPLRVLGAALEDDANITRLRMHVTGDVHDSGRAERDHLFNEAGVGAFARGVDDERGAVAREGLHAGEDVCGVAGHEGDPGRREQGGVERGVMLGRADGLGGELDPGDGCEVSREGEGEETRAAVGVDEVCGFGRGGRGFGWEDGVADVGGEGDQGGVVVLEEGAGCVFEEEVANALADCAFLVCHADVVAVGRDGRGRGYRLRRRVGVEGQGVTQEERRTVFVRCDVSVGVVGSTLDRSMDSRSAHFITPSLTGVRPLLMTGVAIGHSCVLC